MAIYTFENINTQEVVDHSCNISEYDALVEELGSEWQRVFMPLNIISGSLSLGKTDDGWNDVLKRIKGGAGRVNTIQTKN